MKPSPVRAIAASDSLQRNNWRVDTGCSTRTKLIGHGEIAPRASTRRRGLGHNGAVAVKDDCRHYVMQTNSRGEKLERCRVDANEVIPFACPEGCVFYEPRNVSSAGWQIHKRPEDEDEPL